MRKSVFASIFLLSCLAFSSCGGKTVKVTLIGDEHLRWQKSEDKANTNKDYKVSPICDKGYCLYDDPDTLEITIDGIPAFTTQDYSLNDLTQELTIFSKSIKGDIKINAKFSLKISNLKIVIPSCYDTSGLTSVEEEINIENNSIDGKIWLKETSKTMPSKDKIIVSPNDLKFTYEEGEDNKYNFKIDNSEFYRDIRVEFPEI